MAKGSTKTIYGKKTPAEVRAAIQSICEEMDYDPFKELVRYATEDFETIVDGHVVRLPLATMDQKITIAKEIASYIAPKIKNIEVKAEVEGEFTFKIINQALTGTGVPQLEIDPERKKLRQGVEFDEKGNAIPEKIIEAEEVADA